MVCVFIVGRRRDPADNRQVRPSPFPPFDVPPVIARAERLEDGIGIELSLLVILDVTAIVIVKDNEPAAGVADEDSQLAGTRNVLRQFGELGGALLSRESTLWGS